MNCPECGAPITVTDGVIGYHTRPDNLAACTAADVEDKPKARKPRTKK